MTKTGIDWADAVWNPVTGCTPISDGCRNCYAKRMAETRLRGRAGYPEDEPFKVTLHPERIEEPRSRKEPSRIFVCSMGDLLHEAVPASFIFRIFETIEKTPQHTYMILTKRPSRLREIYIYYGAEAEPKNIGLGVTVENQGQTGRIGELLRYPAAFHFVSCEPILGPIRIPREAMVPPRTFNPETGDIFTGPKVDWIIAGCETGPGARPMEYIWAWNLLLQAKNSGAAFFYKKGPGDDGAVRRLPRLEGRRWTEIPSTGRTDRT